MPALSELAGYFADLRAHYGGGLSGSFGAAGLVNVAGAADAVVLSSVAGMADATGSFVATDPPADRTAVRELKTLPPSALSAKTLSIEARSGFERALAVLVGFDKAAGTLRALRELCGSAAFALCEADGVFDPFAANGVVLRPEPLLALPVAVLEAALRPAGNLRLKLPRVRGLLEFIAARMEDGDELFVPGSPFYAPAANPEDLRNLAAFEGLRRDLAGVRGISLESADALLLFAFNYPVFPAGAQAWRFLRRHGFIAEDADYAEMQATIQSALELGLEGRYATHSAGALSGRDVSLPEITPEDAAAAHYKEAWLLLRRLCSEFCTSSKFRCTACPLGAYMEYQPCE